MAGIRARRVAKGKPILFPGIGKTPSTAPPSSTPGGGETDPNKVTRMPDPDDPRQREERRRQMFRKRLSAGRLGTIMSDRLRSIVGVNRLNP